MNNFKEWFKGLGKECRMTFVICIVIFVTLTINVTVDLIHLGRYINHKTQIDEKTTQMEIRIRNLELDVDYIQNALETQKGGK